MEALLASGHVEEQTAASIVRQIAEALAYCHSQGVVHRAAGSCLVEGETRARNCKVVECRAEDVKPENIMLRPGPEPFITLVDFGLASAAGEVVHGGQGSSHLGPLCVVYRSLPLVFLGQVKALLRTWRRKSVAPFKHSARSITTDLVSCPRCRARGLRGLP